MAKLKISSEDVIRELQQTAAATYGLTLDYTVFRIGMIAGIALTGRKLTNLQAFQNLGKAKRTIRKGAKL